MPGVAIVTDSTADLPEELATRLGITVVPLNIFVDGRTWEDRVSMMPDDFMMMTSGETLPSTTAPTVQQFARVYEALAQDHDQILSIHISSRLSGTCASATEARNLFLDGPEITVIDTGSASMGTGLIVKQVAERAQCGAEIGQLTALVENLQARTHVIFMVDTLEHLRRGGRIGRAAEIIGSVLQLKPILTIEEGIVVPQARTRTRNRAITGILQLIEEVPIIESAAVLHTAGSNDLGLIVETLIRKTGDQDLIVSEISPVLSTHIGPRGLGVAFIEGEMA
ncbi:MAG: DegV family protein [Sphaerobacteraceae bacterium]|nr:MAG: DegV family protein [Sphaerobacteraceae bacterium]